MIIDVHTHLLDEGHWPREWWQWVADDWATRAPGRNPSDIVDRIEAGLVDHDGSRMIASMDRAGVDTSVILPIDWGPDFDVPKPIDEVVQHALVLSRKHPNRLVAFGGIDPRRQNASDLVTAWFDAGAKGLKLYPSCGWDPTSVEAHRVYAVAEARRAPVLFHTGDPLPLLDPEYSNPDLLRNVAESHPDLPIWLGHAGAPRWWNEALGLARNHPNVKLEMSVWLWDDSSDSDKARFLDHVAEAVSVLGAGQLVLGTDNVSGPKVRPAGFLENVIGVYRDLPALLATHGISLSERELAQILGGNASRDLKEVRAGVTA